MNINIGDIYQVRPAAGEIPHPQVIIDLESPVPPDQEPVYVIACALTSNPRKLSLPGNVLLIAGEAGLPRQSVVEVGKVRRLPVTQLGLYIGTLSAERVRQIMAGMRQVQRFYLDR